MNFLKAKTKILLLAANPQDTSVLRLGEEIRTIKESLQLGKYRDNFIIRQGEAVRIQDFIRLVLSEKPDIIHFSGHASTAGICLEDENGLMQMIPGRILVKLLSECKNLECIILNACYSKAQADEIKKTVPFVIGTIGSLRDKSAIRFSSGFYYALAENIGIEKAFNYGLISASMETTPNIKPPRTLGIEHIETNTESPILLKGRKKIAKSNSRAYIITSLSLLLTPLPFLIYTYYPPKAEEKTLTFVTITGKVSEELLTNEIKPIANATINFPELIPSPNKTSVSTTSLENGKFEKRYENLSKHKPSDTTRVEVTHPDYKPSTEFLSIYENMPIHLHPKQQPEN